MVAGLGRLARSLEEIGQNFEALFARAPVAYRPYEARAGDVFIACWAKSGTTMMQQMFHQLRMGAATGRLDMDFDDISRMTPWEDTARQIDFDMNTAQRAAPRGFKSHREYQRLPPGMRYVVTLRDPHETYASFHRFFSGYLFEPGTVGLAEFFPLWLMGGPGGCDYCTHLLSWWARRAETDTLVASYRWAAKNRATMIRRLADLIGVAASDELVAMVEAATARDFMVAHRDKFDDAMVKQAMEAAVGVAGLESSKVHAAGSDAGTLPPEIVARIDALWAERVAPVTGHADFAALAAELDGR